MEEEERLGAELRDAIQYVKMNRREGMSLLYLSDPWLLKELPDVISRLDWMVWLDLEGTRVEDLTPLAGMTRMEKLDLRGTPVADLSPLSGMGNLQNLFLEGTRVSDLSPLASCDRLRELWLDGTEVHDLSPLANCRRLRQLSIRGTGVTDLTPLTGLPELSVLDVTGSSVQDLSPVVSLPAFADPEGDVGISFAGTPAAARDRALARIADEDDPSERAGDLMDHLTGGARLTGWRGDA